MNTCFFNKWELIDVILSVIYENSDHGWGKKSIHERFPDRKRNDTGFYITDDIKEDEEKF